GERSAVYAEALAQELSLNSDGVNRVVTAARLHHIGYVTLDDPSEGGCRQDTRGLAHLGGDILRQTGFLAEIADVIEGVSETEPAISLEAAVVWIASAFDDLVG